MVFNYADRPDLTVAEIVATVREVLGLPPATNPSLLGSVRLALMEGSLRAWLRQLRLERRLDSSRAHATGFSAPVPIREALADTARADLAWATLLARARA